MFVRATGFRLRNWSIEEVLSRLQPSSRDLGTKKSRNSILRERHSWHHFRMHPTHMAFGGRSGRHERALWRYAENGDFESYQGTKEHA